MSYPSLGFFFFFLLPISTSPVLLFRLHYLFWFQSEYSFPFGSTDCSPHTICRSLLFSEGNARISLTVALRAKQFNHSKVSSQNMFYTWMWPLFGWPEHISDASDGQITWKYCNNKLSFGYGSNNRLQPVSYDSRLWQCSMTKTLPMCERMTHSLLMGTLMALIPTISQQNNFVHGENIKSEMKGVPKAFPVW